MQCKSSQSIGENSPEISYLIRAQFQDGVLISTHVLNKRGHGVRNLVDILCTAIFRLYKPENPRGGSVVIY
jgi:hypothetical protein